MKTRLWWMMALLAVAGCEDANPGTADAVGDVDPYAGLERIDNTTCQVAGAPSVPPELTLTRVLSGANVAQPLQMSPAPDGSGRIFVVSQPGQILVADGVTEDGGLEPWLDIRGRVDNGPNEGGLLSVAFHPNFQNNGYFYVNYTGREGGQLQTRVSRFEVPDPPLGAPDPDSEVEVITIDQPFGNHNGGVVAFGPDGMLYIGMGDGGSGGDPQGNGQNLGTLLGAFLRLDVTAVGDGPGYEVPADNPFIGQAGAREEIWAYGIRNPWRFSFDPVEGTLWTGEVGQDTYEEIDIIRRGGNYGWNVMEGFHCYGAQECDGEGMEPPIVEYPHSEGWSVTGGHVYRGSALPGLYGTYVFGDFAFGTIWGVSPTGPDQSWERRTLIQPSDLGLDPQITAFGLDGDGELYVVARSGAFYRIEAADPGSTGAPDWPLKLSETGCFADLGTRELAAGILSYDVNAPLWSDGAGKERGLVVPPGQTVGWTDEDALDFPDGTIAIKTFTWQGEPLETRFFAKTDGTWRAATYRWDEGGADATLLTAAATEDLGDGASWYYPSRGDCMTCHTEASGRILGISAAQLNGEHDMFGTGHAVNQLEALRRVGYLSGAPDAGVDALPRFPAPGDAAAPIADRARAYMHSNCAVCHRPGGLANATIDLRASIPLDATGACDADPDQGDLGIAGAKVIAPGDAEASVLYLRMATTDPETRMPSVATSIVDEVGAGLVRDWIDGLSGCSTVP